MVENVYKFVVLCISLLNKNIFDDKNKTDSAMVANNNNNNQVYIIYVRGNFESISFCHRISADDKKN